MLEATVLTETAKKLGDFGFAGDDHVVPFEVGPLDGLPTFVKKLRVVGTEWDAFVLAANAKTRPTRASVHPGTGPWRWYRATSIIAVTAKRPLVLNRMLIPPVGVTHCDQPNSTDIHTSRKFDFVTI